MVRAADRRVVRLIQKWLKAGVLEDGARTRSEDGTPQGGSASPLLANIYLHYVFDLWVQQRRQRHARGDSLAAVPVLRDAIDGYERLQAEQIPGALEAKRDSACALIELGRYDEAEPLIRDALAKTRAIYGEEHQDTAIALQTLGWLLVERGGADEAEPLLRGSLDVFGRLDIPEHLAWLPAQARSVLGQCLTVQGRFDEAEPLLVESYGTIDAAKGFGCIITRIALDRTIAMYEAWGKAESVDQWRAKATATPRPLAAPRRK